MAETDRGQGTDLFQQEGHLKGDARMARRALLKGWPITDEMRQLIVLKMVQVVGKSDKAREQVAAARVLISADEVNARREGFEIPQTVLHGRLDEESNQLAIDVIKSELTIDELRTLEGVSARIECRLAEKEPGADEPVAE